MHYPYNRSFQHLAIAIFLLLLTSLFYLSQSAASYNVDDLSSNITPNVPHPHSPLSASPCISNPSTPPPKSKSKPKVDVNADYSIKPIAYIFPQYYPFEENNRLWGANFTEWSNVNRATHNGFGLEIIRPHDSFGQYNGLEHKTRKRWGEFLKSSGFHGAVFHHYWFTGTPVMDHIVQAMLKDGEPDVPFMLSWANEPWTKRWDGGDGDVLIGQDYGLYEGWRKHFDWLLPFFKSPNYIRSGGKVQFLVYNPTHMGAIAAPMFAAWRQWAIEEGLGGLDVMETYWSYKDGPDRWKGAYPDAMNEFQPHAGGRDHARLSSSKKVSRVYHRGSLVCWDTTPRHLNASVGMLNPTCHPNTWKHHLVEMFRTIKADPNPVGQENFFFINALNEWGEGNAFEPSNQFGFGYGEAMKAAIEISDKEHQWPVTAENRRIKEAHIEDVLDKIPDVCVLVQVAAENGEDQKFKLTAMLRSLQAQKNENWRALVIDEGNLGGQDRFVKDTLDPRIHSLGRHEIPESNDQKGVKLLDIAIEKLNRISQSCATAKFLLITDGGTSYEKSAFDIAETATGDLIGLNFESKQSLFDLPDLQNRTWEERCTKLVDPKVRLCNPSTPTSFDLAATFINTTRFTIEQHHFDAFTPQHAGHQGAAMAKALTNERGWRFSHSPSHDCHVHVAGYTSCILTGNFWFDSPKLEEMGCWTSGEFTGAFEKTFELPAMRDFDLQYMRKEGLGECVRYKEEKYWNITAPPPPPPPPPPPEPVANATESATSESATPESATPEGDVKNELVKEKEEVPLTPDDGREKR